MRGAAAPGADFVLVPRARVAFVRDEVHALALLRSATGRGMDADDSLRRQAAALVRGELLLVRRPTAPRLDRPEADGVPLLSALMAEPDGDSLT